MQLPLCVQMLEKKLAEQRHQKRQMRLQLSLQPVQPSFVPDGRQAKSRAVC